MRRTLIVVPLLVFLLVGGAPVLAGPADKEFRMFGSGFGHGLGMSQWGAYGLAQRGWSPSRILSLYYSGTRVGAAEDPPRTLRVGLIQGQDAVRLQAEAGDVEIRVGDPRDGNVVATIPEGETWRVRVADTRYRIVNQAGDTVDSVGGTNTPIFAVYEPQGARVRIPEASHTYGRGDVEFGLYECGAAGCEMRLIAVVDAEEYLYGLGEVPSSWPMSALKAQAIAARSYAFTKAAAGQHRPVCDCALYATTFDQVYAGWDKEAALDGDRWVSSVDQTDNRVVRDAGQTIQAFYMSSSGGHTENNEDVWGGSPIGYLRGVCDPGDYTAANPSAIWDVTFTAGHVTSELGLGIGTVTGFVDPVRGVSGRILTVTVRGQSGTTSISGATLRSSLGLRDDRVWINRNRQVTGDIRARYDERSCSAGLPLSAQVQVAGGERQRFEEATIYRSDATGAHQLDGAVLDAYLDEGGPAGKLGFPTSDVRRLDNGNLRASFEHGAITCVPGGSCRVD